MRKAVVILTLNLFLNGCAYHYQSQTPQRPQIYVKTHPELSNRIKDCILKSAICTGMTIEDVKQAWNHLDWEMSSRSADGSTIWDGFTPSWKMIEGRWYDFSQTKVTLYFGRDSKLEIWTEWPD